MCVCICVVCSKWEKRIKGWEDETLEFHPVNSSLTHSESSRVGK